MKVAFDTLDYAKKLEMAGVPASQAEQQSTLLAEVLGKSIAFSGDLVPLGHNVSANIDAITLKLSSKIESETLKISANFDRLIGRFDTLIWMTGTLIALNSLIALKLFMH